MVRKFVVEFFAEIIVKSLKRKSGFGDMRVLHVCVVR